MAGVDPSRTIATMDRAERNIRFGIARGLTQIAKAAQADLSAETVRVFDRPTPTTVNAFAIRPASRELLEAEVFAKDFMPKGTPPSRYLRAQVYGGARSQKRSERALTRAGLTGNKGFWVPARRAKLNAFGNFPGSLFTRMLSDLRASPDPMQDRTERSSKRKPGRTRFFVPKPGSKLPHGVWQRMGKKIAAVLMFVPSVTYQRRFDFFGVVARTVSTKGPEILRRSIEDALRTMR